MKAISLWQPWATLMAIGAKTIETRGRPTQYRGPIAIHAAKRLTRDEIGLCHEQPFASALRAGGYETVRELPLGALVCVVTLVDCIQIPEGTPAQGKLFGDGVLVRGVTLPPDGDELAFGNYAPGRYAWITRDLRKLSDPVPWPGKQWLFDVPDEVIR